MQCSWREERKEKCPFDFSIQQGSPVFNLKRAEQCKEGISVPDRQGASGLNNPNLYELDSRA